MQTDPRHWMKRLPNLCEPLTGQEIALLGENPGLERRVALALRITGQRAMLETTQKAEVAPQPDIAGIVTPPLVTDDAAASEPAPEETEAVPKKRRKASFSAVSLDDAASLLTAFGAAGEPETPAELQAAQGANEQRDN